MEKEKEPVVPVVKRPRNAYIELNVDHSRETLRAEDRRNLETDS
jgi:hypothetical protein